MPSITRRAHESRPATRRCRSRCPGGDEASAGRRREVHRDRRAADLHRGAGVARSTFYSNFRDKTDLIMRLTGDMMAVRLRPRHRVEPGGRRRRLGGQLPARGGRSTGNTPPCGGRGVRRGLPRTTRPSVTSCDSTTRPVHGMVGGVDPGPNRRQAAPPPRVERGRRSSPSSSWAANVPSAPTSKPARPPTRTPPSPANWR